MIPYDLPPFFVQMKTDRLEAIKNTTFISKTALLNKSKTTDPIRSGYAALIGQSGGEASQRRFCVCPIHFVEN